VNEQQEVFVAHCHSLDFALTPPPATPVMFNTWRLSAGQVQSSNITLIQSWQLRSPRSLHHHCRTSGYHSSHCTHLHHSLCRCPIPSSYCTLVTTRSPFGLSTPVQMVNWSTSSAALLEISVSLLQLLAITRAMTQIFLCSIPLSVCIRSKRSHFIYAKRSLI
jgi:hypothetical protein